MGRPAIVPAPPPLKRGVILSPASAYRALLRRFGRQGWWPVTPAGGRSPAYRPGAWGRLSERQRLEVCLGALLTQNTAWTNASRALESLHAAGCVGLAALKRLPARRLGALVRPSGYFRQKALKIKAFAAHAESTGKDLAAWLSGPLESLRAELLSIHGVGPETADSILLYAGFRPSFVVDAYTMRIGARLGWLGPRTTYDETAAFFKARLPASAEVYGEYHALLVGLAKRHCRKTPVCEGCPLRQGCGHGRTL